MKLLAQVPSHAGFHRGRGQCAGGFPQAFVGVAADAGPGFLRADAPGQLLRQQPIQPMGFEDGRQAGGPLAGIDKPQLGPMGQAAQQGVELGALVVLAVLPCDVLAVGEYRHPGGVTLFLDLAGGEAFPQRPGQGKRRTPKTGGFQR